jgi:hypothetical protein
MTFAVVANLPARSAADGRLAAALDAVDQADVDDLGVPGAPAGIVDGVGAVAAHQPEEPVDLAHLGPRQRMLQHGGRVRAAGSL